jgi:hypothetical protein
MSQGLANVGIIGLGKRVKTFYANILSELKGQFKVSGFTKKTSNGIESIKSQYGFDFYPDVKSLLRNKPDIVIVSVPAQAIDEVLSNLSGFSGVVIIDTPISFDVDKYNLNCFAFEQWPFLPIEQFKKKIIFSGLLGEPIFAENDTRTFEYHGIAQLKSYFNKNEQIAKLTTFPNIVGGKDSWSIAAVNFSSGKGFLYKFSYFSKKSKFRPQQIKLYFSNGGIISGCLNDKGNDYEIIKIFSESEEGSIKVTRSENQIKNKETSFHSGSNYFEIKSIKCSISGEEVSWENPFLGSGFNDQEIAIATILTEAKNIVDDKGSNMIPAKSSLEDYLISRSIS